MVMSAHPEQSPPVPPNPAAQMEPKPTEMEVESLSPEELNKWIGRVIDGRYRVVRLLGAGGMGAVFIAEQLKLKKDVALKVIRKEWAEEAVFASRFEREAMTTAQLENPHVVSAIDYGRLPEGGAYLVLQLAPGSSLADVLNQHGALPWPQACSLGAQLADAMVAAHAIGIVHRDLKPDNILVEVRSNSRIHARVLDFGLARIIHGDALEGKGISIEALTRQGALIGTPGYMAPEQITGGSVDARADLYALGVILWECITGRPLWRAASFTELFSKQLGQVVPSLRGEQAGQVPEPLIQLVAKLTSQKADDRPASAEPVRKLLEELALSGGVGPQMSGSMGIQPLSEMTPNSPRAHPQGVGTLALAREQIARDPATRKALMYLAIAALLIVPISLAIGLGLGGSSGGDAGDFKDMPAELSDAVKALERGTKSSDREEAALKILSHEPAESVPKFARLGAKVTVSKTCEEVEDAVGELKGLGDGRAVGVLKRLAEDDRTCEKGKKKVKCGDCLGDALSKAIDALDG